MPKKILIFSLVYYPRFIGGAEVAVKEITDRISPDEVEFHMVTVRTHAAPYEKIGNVHVHRVGTPWSGTHTQSSRISPLSKYLFPFFAFWKAHSLHAEHKYSAVWSIMANYAGFGALFFKLFHMKVPFVLTLQEGDPIDHIQRRVRFVSPVFRMIFTHADAVQAISRYLADFAKSMGAKTEPIVVPNGADMKLFSADIPDEMVARVAHEIDKADGDVFIVTTSRLVEKNAVRDIIRSLSSLPHNVKLLVIGTGPLEADLKRLAQDLGLSSRVVFKGFVDHADMPAYLAASDVFVRPSLSEGFGNSFIEAMAAGLPVVATPVGGIPDFLRNKETGLFCDVSSPADIARKIEVYLRDTALRDEIIDNAFHMVIDQYDWSKIARDMKERVFDKVFSAS